MLNHFSMGAINKTTNKYEYPKIANKSNKYKCPFCEKDVIFRNGKIKNQILLIINQITLVVIMKTQMKLKFIKMQNY